MNLNSNLVAAFRQGNWLFAEREDQLAEDDEEGWREYERQLHSLTDLRERVAAECKE